MEENKLIYAHDTMEFVTVAVKFCAFLEQIREQTKTRMVDTLVKMIPLLYLKAQLLPKVTSDGEFLTAPQVTEGDYNWVRSSVYEVLGEEDEYLDVSWGEEELQTDETRWRSVAEHLADAYQPLRDFLAVYQNGNEESMMDALWALEQQFTEYWGQALVDALRQLHRIQCSLQQNQEEDYD